MTSENGGDHYTEAGRLLAAPEFINLEQFEQDRADNLAEAHVRATLAMTDAVRALADIYHTAQAAADRKAAP